MTYESSVIVIGLPDSTSSDSLNPILQDFSATIQDSIYDWGIWLLRIPDTLNVIVCCDSINAYYNVDWAEPNMLGEDQIVDDTHFVLQWNLRNTGQQQGVPNADVDIENAWALCVGNENAIIAILDTGLCTH